LYQIPLNRTTVRQQFTITDDARLMSSNLRFSRALALSESVSEPDLPRRIGGLQ
jgi:hypothetical protein